MLKQVSENFKIKLIFNDVLWSISGLVLMNVAAQVVVYPYWNYVLGSEAYGNIVYLLAIMNIMGISVGCGINYARMRQSASGETKNRPYSLLMSAGTLISVLIMLLLKEVGLLRTNNTEFLLLCVLMSATMWRYYADVEFRLHINYKGYFLYYLVIGAGYLFGTLLFKLTLLWPLALMPGEFAGLLYVWIKGSIFRGSENLPRQEFAPILKLSLLLVGTNCLSHLVFNGDRIILQLFAGSTAVSIYYIASLFGKTMSLITTPLNGVLIGHLAKYNGKLTNRLMHFVTGMTGAAIALSTVICVIASLVILPLLYPSDFGAVRQYLLLANAAQTIYFISNILTASVLLRFTAAKNQLIVNVSHGIIFVALCIPLALYYGIRGFCWGMLIVNVFRYLLCIILGYTAIQKQS